MSVFQFLSSLQYFEVADIDNKKISRVPVKISKQMRYHWIAFNMLYLAILFVLIINDFKIVIQVPQHFQEVLGDFLQILVP